MHTFDAMVLKTALLKACRIAFAKIREKHQGEAFYCMALFTTGSFDYLVPTAMTEEGLDAVLRRYQADPHYAGEPEETLRFSLRWSPCDSPLHLESEEYFNEVNDIMSDISSTLGSIDIDHGWEEFEDFVGRVEDSICDVLETLNHEGAFGIDKDRERVFVTILMGDQDDSLLRIGRRLNPPPTVDRFEKEWEKW